MIKSKSQIKLEQAFNELAKPLNSKIDQLILEKDDLKVSLERKQKELEISNNRYFELQQKYNKDMVNNNNWANTLINNLKIPLGSQLLDNLAKIGVKLDIAYEQMNFGTFIIFYSYVKYFRNFFIFKNGPQTLINSAYDVLEQLALNGHLYITYSTKRKKFLIMQPTEFKVNEYNEIIELQVSAIYGENQKSIPVDLEKYKGVYVKFNENNFSLWVTAYAFCENVYSQLQLINQNVNYLKNMFAVTSLDNSFIENIQTQIENRQTSFLNIPKKSLEEGLSENPEIADLNLGSDAKEKINALWFSLNNYIEYWEPILGVRNVVPDGDKARNNEAEIIPSVLKNDKIQFDLFNRLNDAFEKLQSNYGFKLDWAFNDLNHALNVIDNPIKNSTTNENPKNAGVKNEFN